MKTIRGWLETIPDSNYYVRHSWNPRHFLCGGFGVGEPSLKPVAVIGMVQNRVTVSNG
jgi:hypothetical protein